MVLNEIASIFCLHNYKTVDKIRYSDGGFKLVERCTKCGTIRETNH